jgi:hypothetical protein
VATVKPCVATVSAPARPPSSIHHGIVRERTAAASRRAPARPAGTSATSSATITSPDPNEIVAATSPSSSAAPREPLTRACTAVSTPTSTVAPAAAHSGNRRGGVGSEGTGRC